MTDLDAPITVARDDLRRLVPALVLCYHHRYTADLAPPEAAAKRPKGKRHVTHSPWLQATTVHRAYIEALQELARANRAMLGGTDVPEGCDTWWTAQMIGGETHDGGHVSVAWRESIANRAALTMPLDTAIDFAAKLSAMLEWARGEDLRPPEANAVLEACGHASSAVNRIPPALCPDLPQRCANRPCPDDPRPGGAECHACARWRQRKGESRPIGAVA